MSYTKEELRKIYDRTEGRCHICRKQLAFKNYGAPGERGAWEVEHSVPRAKGGSNRRQNLYPAHVTCNRAKGSRSTSQARAKHGFKNAPFSSDQRLKHGLAAGGAVALISLLVPPHVRLGVALVGGVVGFMVGHDSEPE